MQPLMPPINTPDNLFHDGNPTTGVEGTIVPAEHLNNEQGSIRDVQSEMIAILTAAAMAPDSTAGQLLAALNKLYAPGNDTLGALASLVGAANKLPYFTGPKGAALTDLTAFARTLLSRSDAAGVLSDLQLGEAAKQGVATNQQMQDGTATNLLPSVAAVMSLFSKRSFSMSDFIRIPDVPGGLIIQWGIMSTADANGLCSANLPIKFPVGPLVVPSPAYYNDSRNNITMTVVSTTPTQIQVFASYAHTNVPAVGAPLRYVILGR
ncbi:gp53-like domain-containing protein [Enterobacter roggenkampii]|uniref:gp53-like domain-containing protein n=2 Tax=Enterobacteriaceae TaxID=543 RepID=UPI001F555516|nr:hypothetical protein [Enterobacter roggenkampii]